MHESWCAAQYRGEAGPGACDCGAEQKALAQQSPRRMQWKGELPDQFCVLCEDFPVRLIVVRPKVESAVLRLHAACLACGHMRELDINAVI